MNVTDVFLIHVNKGPPVFETELEDLLVEVGEVKEYAFPKISDPDSD